MWKEPKKKDFSSEMKEKLKKVASYFCVIVVMVAAVLYVFADKVFNASSEIYKRAIFIVIGGYFVVFLAALIVFVISLIKFKRDEIYEEVVNDFRDNCKKIDTVTNHISQTNEKIDAVTKHISQTNEKVDALTVTLDGNIEKERSLITQLEIGQFVLNRDKVIELEASVGNFDGRTKKCKIYIQSSLFVLEKGPLEKTILWNLRKGVKYIYIIPNKEVNINNYYYMLSDWYRVFSQFLNSKGDYEREQEELNNESRYKKYWCQEYQKIYDEVGRIWGDKRISEEARKEKIDRYSEECKGIFKTLIETHINDENEFFITVAAYEISRNNWEVIIKLPTQNTNKEYYAFQIPNENNSEMDDFMRKFQGIYKSSAYKPEDLSTLGGKMELDYSRIFN